MALDMMLPRLKCGTGQVPGNAVVHRKDLKEIVMTYGKYVIH
jgi:hypothetical protein